MFDTNKGDERKMTNRQKQSREDNFKKIVKICMIRNGIRSTRDLAPIVGIEERALYRRMRFETSWTIEELWRLFRVLNPSKDEVAEMMGVSADA